MKKGQLFYVVGSYSTIDMQVKCVCLSTSKDCWQYFLRVQTGVYLAHKHKHIEEAFLPTSATLMSCPNLF